MLQYQENDGSTCIQDKDCKVLCHGSKHCRAFVGIVPVWVFKTWDDKGCVDVICRTRMVKGCDWFTRLWRASTGLQGLFVLLRVWQDCRISRDVQVGWLPRSRTSSPLSLRSFKISTSFGLVEYPGRYSAAFERFGIVVPSLVALNGVIDNSFVWRRNLRETFEVPGWFGSWSFFPGFDFDVIWILMYHHHLHPDLGRSLFHFIIPSLSTGGGGCYGLFVIRHLCTYLFIALVLIREIHHSLARLKHNG